VWQRRGEVCWQLQGGQPGAALRDGAQDEFFVVAELMRRRADNVLNIDALQLGQQGVVGVQEGEKPLKPPLNPPRDRRVAEGKAADRSTPGSARQWSHRRPPTRSKQAARAALHASASDSSAAQLSRAITSRSSSAGRPSIAAVTIRECCDRAGVADDGLLTEPREDGRLGVWAAAQWLAGRAAL
jgi:hypothetical protein